MKLSYLSTVLVLGGLVCISFLRAKKLIHVFQEIMTMQLFATDTQHKET